MRRSKTATTAHSSSSTWRCAATGDGERNSIHLLVGLNRSILDASPFELRRQLEYKTRWRGGLLVSVPPQNTSRKCPECQHIAAENRKTQAKFVCVECGFSAHADFVGAVNIKEAGLALLACLFRACPSVHGGEDVK